MSTTGIKRVSPTAVGGGRTQAFRMGAGHSPLSGFSGPSRVPSLNELIGSASAASELSPRGSRELKWELGSREYVIRQLAYLPAEGVGVNGTYFIKGALALNGQELFASAMGFTAAAQQGRVQFSAWIMVELNGREIASGFFRPNEKGSAWPVDEYIAIGSLVIELPAPKPSDEATITIRGSYIYSAPEGSAAPVPYSNSITIPLNLVEV